MTTPASGPAGSPMRAGDEGLRRLEKELKVARRFGERATKQMHIAMAADVKKAQTLARRAEKKAAAAITRAREATRRAKRAERELAELKQSRTWKAGRVVVAIPKRLKRGGRS